MNRKSFISALPFMTLLASFTSKSRVQNNIKIQLLRHATLVLEINGKKILVDPMLSPKDGMDPVQNCGNDIRIPMVDLPINESEQDQLLKDVDAIVVTHTHRDHWDAVAQSKIDKSKTIFCQPIDKEKIEKQGFKNVTAVDDSYVWEGIKIARTGGQHGTGEIGKRMGTVSGFVLQVNKKSIYVAGDTIWCPEVEKAIGIHKPNVIVLNAGGAKFLTGDPITMTPEDIMQVRKQSPKSKIIAVHMDTVNHCFVKRDDLRRVLDDKQFQDIFIPADGETIKA